MKYFLSPEVIKDLLHIVTLYTSILVKLLTPDEKDKTADDLTIYGSVFVAAAETEKIPLLTADYKHHAKKISKQIIFYDEWKK